MKILLLIKALLIFTLSTSAQDLFYEMNGEQLQSDQIVASIDTINISAKEFFYNYEFGPSFTKRQKNSKEVHLNFMINEKLLALESISKGLLNNLEIESIFEDITSDIATEEMFKDKIISQIEIKDAEIEEVIGQKQTEIKLRWIYSNDKPEIDGNLSPKHFDSLFASQLNDSVFLDQRQLQISLFNLNKKNPDLARIIDTMKARTISLPINVNSEWYIISYDNVIFSRVVNESELNRNRKEAVDFLSKQKMDYLSDTYVNQILYNSKALIKRDAFNILISYLGKYLLKKKKYDEWFLENKMEIALNNLGLTKNEMYPGIVLVEINDKQIFLEDFINWYKNRELYIKIRKNNYKDYSKSFENLIWQMNRDYLLKNIAQKENYFNARWVKEQSNWWKEKIAYSALRNEYSKSFQIQNNEILSNDTESISDNELNRFELSKKILYKLNEQKRNYKIIINKSILDQIKVSSVNDKKAIDFYSIKKGGLIPRPAYPSIDPEWANWQ